MEREYVWGPGDNGLDEILVQYDIERKAFWMIQDGGGDVVAMCDLQGSGGTARVVKSWQYDAYGQCLRATDVVTSTSGYSIPLNRIGHKGLFMDRLDKGLANPSTYADNKRLEPFSTVLYQNRNRTYSPQLGRFIQRDPNESGQLLAGIRQNSPPSANGLLAAFSLAGNFRDSGNCFSYLRTSPWMANDPAGLFTYIEVIEATTEAAKWYDRAQMAKKTLGIAVQIAKGADAASLVTMFAAELIFDKVGGKSFDKVFGIIGPAVMRKLGKSAHLFSAQIQCYAGKSERFGKWTVHFNELGYPDLKPFSKGEVTVPFSGNTIADLDKAAIEYCKKYNVSRIPPDLVGHHELDLQTIVFVPRELHGQIGHIGGSGLAKHMNDVIEILTGAGY